MKLEKVHVRSQRVLPFVVDAVPVRHGKRRVIGFC